jgi:hypothetical protein
VTLPNGKKMLSTIDRSGCATLPEQLQDIMLRDVDDNSYKCYDQDEVVPSITSRMFKLEGRICAVYDTNDATLCRSWQRETVLQRSCASPDHGVVPVPTQELKGGSVGSSPVYHCGMGHTETTFRYVANAVLDFVDHQPLHIACHDITLLMPPSVKLKPQQLVDLARASRVLKKQKLNHHREISDYVAYNRDVLKIINTLIVPATGVKRWELIVEVTAQCDLTSPLKVVLVDAREIDPAAETAHLLEAAKNLGYEQMLA